MRVQNTIQPFITDAKRMRRSGRALWLIFVLVLASSSGTAFGALPPADRQTELAGNSLSSYPYFEYVKAFNEDATVEVAIDPTRFPGIVGQTGDIYVVVAKTASLWSSDPSLVDVAGGPQTVTFGGSTIQANTVLVAAPYDLSGDAGTGLGVGYDVVIDMDQDGTLSYFDYVDGLGHEAGLYMIHDLTQDGPLAVTEILYDGGYYLDQDTYYPTGIASMGELPLIVISHGNGHNYRWYDHIGYHMASYGYIVMSHSNNTGPGIETASTTTLTNTDYIIGNQATIGGGVLNGHIDSHRITWIGHSRGGEGITRAYDRIYDGTYTPSYFTIEDIVLLSSMAPTDFLGTSSANPHDANYHLWTAASDADVYGGAGNDIAQTFHLHDRATGYRHSTVLHGVGHGDLHDGGGSSVASGPCLIGRSRTHLIQKGFFLPLIKYYVEGNIPAADFLWRQWESFKPIGAPSTTCSTTGGDGVVVNNTFRNGSDTGNFMIDDYQSHTEMNVSSSGGSVTYSVYSAEENRLDDNNSSFTWLSSDPMNGMTYGRSSDTTRGVVFDWSIGDRYYEWEIIPAERDLSDDLYLSFRACQGTRHTYTIAVIEDLTFTVTLRDGSGVTSSINIGAYGGGLEDPYQRSGEGSGTGWHNDFESIRIRLTDFLANGSGLDLSDIAAVRFDCGPSWGSNEGRIGVDELMITNDVAPPAEPCFDGILSPGEVRIDCGGTCPPCDCLSDGECEDGLFCTGDETCDEYGDCRATGNPCSDGTECTDDICYEVTEQCDNQCAATGPDDPCCDEAACLDEPICVKFTLEMDISYASGILSLDFLLGTPEPAQWATYLVLTFPSVQVIPIWTIGLPVIEPAMEVPVSFPLSVSGMVGLYSGLFNEGGLRASVFEWTILLPGD